MDDDTAPPSPARLVLEHLDWACQLARRKASLIYQLDPEEAAGEATLALVGAAQRYRPSTGVPFRNFAAPRIIGAIIDYHRNQDTAGRHQRQRINRGETTRHLSRGWVPPERSGHDVGDMAEYLAAPRCPTAEDLTLMAEVYRIVRALPAPFCNVIERQYFRGETQEAIGVSMGVSPSRVCQLARVGVAMLALAVKDRAT